LVAAIPDGGKVARAQVVSPQVSATSIRTIR
jgi:hypothetical protein